ncbi:hypothetical protein ACIRQP_24225 [Streptomyces sp. NPDC102274]|uniref:hypothetical protein n=1 Tax=Streptomyces sp. NPDC102274 TaxID=3366151 RepID=UPI00381C870F
MSTGKGFAGAEQSEAELIAEMAGAERDRGRSFEQVMLLGGDEVVEAAHELHAAVREIDWQATGKTVGTLEEWRAWNRAAFREINEFHEAARVDLGVQGKVTGDHHPERDLLLPAARREGDGAST